MPSTSSHHPNRLPPVTVLRPGASVRRAVPRPRLRTRLGGRHVLLIRPEDARERVGVGAHTAGLTDHLNRTAASVCVLQVPASAAGTRVRSLTAGLPHPPDVVIAVLPGLAGAVAAARVARRFRAPLVLVAHDLLAAHPDGAGGRGLTIAAAAERRLLRAADRIAAVVPELAEPLYRLGIPAEHVHLLPHWAPVTATGSPGEQGAARRALGWPVRSFTVVAPAGRRACTDLATLRAVADQLRGEAVVMVLDDATSRPAPQAADVLLLAERPDATDPALPRTLAHYLAAGRPVVAAAARTSPVAAELERAAGAGIVVPPGRPDLLAAAVRSLRADQQLRLAMGHTAAGHAAARMDRDATMHQLETMLCGALGDVLVDLTTA